MPKYRRSPSGSRDRQHGRALIRQGALVLAKNCGPVLSASGHLLPASVTPLKTQATRSTTRADLCGVVLRSSFQDHWVVYWFGIRRRSRIHRRHLTVLQSASDTSYNDADLVALASSSVPQMEDGAEALKIFVDTYGTDNESRRVVPHPSIVDLSPGRPPSYPHANMDVSAVSAQGSSKETKQGKFLLQF